MVYKHLLNHSRGEERFAFLYVAISAAVLAGAMTYSVIARLSWSQSLLVFIGGFIGAWATVYVFLELRRLAQTPEDRAREAPEQPDPYAARRVAVTPPTGEPCVHHEYYRESEGFDQGQLTSRLPDETPLVDLFLSWRRKKQMAGRS